MNVATIFAQLHDPTTWPAAPERPVLPADASDLRPPLRPLEPATLEPWAPPRDPVDEG